MRSKLICSVAVTIGAMAAVVNLQSSLLKSLAEIKAVWFDFLRGGELWLSNANPRQDAECTVEIAL